MLGAVTIGACRMSSGVIERAIERQMHWEAARTALRSVVQWGSVGQVATGAEISRRYLWKLLWQEGASPPSPRVAVRLARSVARNLRLPPEQEQDLREHLLLATSSQAGMFESVKQHSDWLDREAVDELTRVHWLATYAKTPQFARNYYATLLTLGEAVVLDFHHAMRCPLTRDVSQNRKYALTAARAHTLLHDACCVFNRPVSALYHAQMARALLERVEGPGRPPALVITLPWSGEAQVDDYSALWVNAVRIEAVSQYLLGFHYQAERLCEEALHSEAVQRQPDVWLPHIFREKLNTLAQDPSATADEIKECLSQARSVSEALDDELGLLLFYNASGRGYLLRGRGKEARDALHQGLALVDRSQEVGQLHKALLFSTLAAFHRSQGHEDEWRFYVGQTLSIAHGAGLAEVTHSLSQTHRDHPGYRDIYEEIMGEALPGFY